MGGDFCMQILVNLQSGRFEKKSPKWGGISACRFQSICRVADLRKNLQNGGGDFCMQILVNLQSGRFEKKSPKWGGDFCMQILVNLQSSRFDKKSPN